MAAQPATRQPVPGQHQATRRSQAQPVPSNQAQPVPGHVAIVYVAMCSQGNQAHSAGNVQPVAKCSQWPGFTGLADVRQL